MKKKVFHFHIGRGGRFNDPGHMTFVGIEPMYFREYDNIFEFDEDGNPLPDDEWYTHDGVGELLLTGKAAIKAETGILDYDGEYDTEIFKYLDDCDEDELWLIAKEIGKVYELDEDERNYILEYSGYLPSED